MCSESCLGSLFDFSFVFSTVLIRWRRTTFCSIANDHFGTVFIVKRFSRIRRSRYANTIAIGDRSFFFFFYFSLLSFSSDGPAPCSFSSILVSISPASTVSLSSACYVTALFKEFSLLVETDLGDTDPASRQKSVRYLPILVKISASMIVTVAR